MLDNISNSAENQLKYIFCIVSDKLFSVGEEIIMPWCRSEQWSQFCKNIPIDNAEEYYRTVFLQFVANIQSQVKTRFAEHSNILAKFLHLIKKNEDKIDFVKLAKFYLDVESSFCGSNEQPVCEFDLWKIFLKESSFKSVWE